MLQKYNPENADIKIWIGDRLFDRMNARVSVFDSSVQGGDAVWEGLRVYKQGIFCLDKHLIRLLESAKVLDFADIPDKDFVKSAIKETLDVNGMKYDAHVRLTLTRGEKITSGMDPRLNKKGSCLIVLAEWKKLVYDNTTGIKVITSSQRRNNPQFLDSKIHHNNLLNNILAKIQANHAGADAAIMLDHNGFVAELNDTNMFMTKNDELLTSQPDACLPGITRSIVIECAKSVEIKVIERNLSLAEFYNADEVFATGTMGEITPIYEIDGRKIENESGKSVMRRIKKSFVDIIPRLCEKI